MDGADSCGQNGKQGEVKQLVDANAEAQAAHAEK